LSDSPSETPTDEAGEPDPIARLAERVAGLVGADEWTADFGLAKLRVRPDGWVAAAAAARDKAGLEFLSFLSAIDWSNDVKVGEPPEGPVDERFEILVCLASCRNGDQVVISTDISKEDPRLPSLTTEFGGAAWHEREAAEMFGIQFDGLANTAKLYLPDGFEGFPLRKSFQLLSREVKPWPGLVDVEGMPGTENGEGDEAAPAEEGEGE
jgi:NADH-quinone oxidoreductase subunit C